MKISKEKFSSYKLNKSQLSEIKGGTSDCVIWCISQGGGRHKVNKCIASCGIDLPIK